MTPNRTLVGFTLLAPLFACGDDHTTAVATPAVEATQSMHAAQLLQPSADKSLCVYATSARAGNIVQLGKCDGSEGQHWSYVGEALQVYGNQCLTVAEGADKFTHIEILPCDANVSAQHWVVGKGKIAWGGSGQCLDLEGDLAVMSAALKLSDCDDNRPTQGWRLR